MRQKTLPKTHTNILNTTLIDGYFHDSTFSFIMTYCNVVVDYYKPKFSNSFHFPPKLKFIYKTLTLQNMFIMVTFFSILSIPVHYFLHHRLLFVIRRISVISFYFPA